jgi:hypothetical protein
MMRTVEDAAVQAIVERLQRCCYTVSPEEVAAVVRGHFDRLEDRPVRQFIPLLVERAARADLGPCRRF